MLKKKNAKMWKGREGGMTTNSRFHMRKKKNQTHTETSEAETKPYIRQPTVHTVQELGVWKEFNTKAFQWEAKVAMDEHIPFA